MLSPYGAREPITGIYELLERWCADQIKEDIATAPPPLGGSAGGFYMPDLSGRWTGLVTEEQCYLAAFAGQRGCYGLWAIAGFTIQCYGGASITAGDLTCAYVTDGFGCSTDPGGLCTPYVPGVGSNLVDVPVPGRIYVTSSQDELMCPVAELYEVPILWVLGILPPGRPRFRQGTTTWRAMALIDDDGSGTPDAAWERLFSLIDGEDNSSLDDTLGNGTAPIDEDYQGGD